MLALKESFKPNKSSNTDLANQTSLHWRWLQVTESRQDPRSRLRQLGTEQTL